MNVFLPSHLILSQNSPCLHYNFRCSSLMIVITWGIEGPFRSGLSLHFSKSNLKPEQWSETSILKEELEYNEIDLAREIPTARMMKEGE